MPRSPDPALESRLIAAAIRLLDHGGESAITLRAVAKEAGTTTPSLYERFPSRDALMQQLVDHVTDEIMTLIEPKRSIEAIYREYLRYSRTHPKRLNLSVSIFWTRFVEGEEMPAYDLLKGRIQEQIGIRGRSREDLALAIASLAFGTAQGMIAAGVETRQAAELQRSSLQALRMLLGAFPTGNQARGTSKGGRAKQTSR
jgi:AcrR family transcriptional regulator